MKGDVPPPPVQQYLEDENDNDDDQFDDLEGIDPEVIKAAMEIGLNPSQIRQL
jgi:hypothetical protein